MQEYKIYTGIIKNVLTEEQYNNYKAGSLDIAKLKLSDCIQSSENFENPYNYLDIRLSYHDIDFDGNQKYKQLENGEFVEIYERTPKLRAFSKELRILTELGVGHPVKIIVERTNNEGYVSNKVVCVQDNKKGKIKKEK